MDVTTLFELEHRSPGDGKPRIIRDKRYGDKTPKNR
jgi:hypothetical protein